MKKIDLKKGITTLIFLFLFSTLIISAQTPNIPDAPIVNYNCGVSSNTVTLTRGIPPIGVTWYWQSSLTGTSTSNSDPSVTKTYGSSYYLRARDNSSNSWSTSLVINYSINSTPSKPSSYSIAVVENDGNTVLTRSNPPTGITYYWQETIDGTSTSNSNESITLTSGTVHYLRAQDDITDCWGDAVSKSYIIKPAVPLEPLITYICSSSGSNSVLLTMNTNVIPSGVTWYWQSSPTGTSTSNSNPSVTRTSGSSYYLRARDISNGEWSSSIAISYIINYIPSVPSSPTVVNNPTSVTITRGTPSAGITWYWQPTSDGESLDNSDSSITLTNSAFHYLRARDNSTGCWSSARQIAYAINPDIPTLTYTCGSSSNTATLTRGTPPVGVTWYWQSSATGTSTVNMNPSITLTNGSTYYIRARNNITGDWSGSTVVNYVINSKPATPSIFSISVIKNDGNTVLTRSNPPSGITYYWQSTSNEESTADSNESATLTTGTVYYLRGKDDVTGCWGDALLINYTVKPTIPTESTVTYVCGSSSNSAALTMDTNAIPLGITWYWQNYSSGTSTTNSNPSITLTSGSTYYLKAQNNTTGEWSSAIPINYTIKSIPTTPHLYTSINKAYIDGTVVLTRDNPPSGVTWYWQSAINGISTDDSNTSVTLSNGSVYYLRGKDDVTGCWSNSKSIHYALMPDVPTIIENCDGTTTLTMDTNAIPSDITWYWQSNSWGTNTTDLNQSKVLASGNIYYLKAQNNITGEWSAARTINYTLKIPIATPTAPSVVNNIGNTVITRGNPPAGIIWYWQSTIDGIEISNDLNNITLTNGNVYYLRSYNSTSGCWSDAKVINYTVTPYVPDMPTITNNCGETVLYKGTPVNSEVVWYWQNASLGVDTSNSNPTISFTSGSVYYLRAKNTLTNVWGASVSINYTVKSQPQIPNQPTITYNNGSTTLTKVGTPPVGINWYWQSVIDGISIEDQNATITLTGGTQYFLKAYNSSTDCWSDAKVVNYSVESDPLPPTIASVVNDCGNSTLTRNNPIIANETWYWQGYATGTSKSYPSESIVRTYGNVYYLRAYNQVSNKWSVATTVNYTMTALPDTPTIVSKTYSNGYATITRGNPPAGITWYWQTSYNGTATTNSNVTIILAEGQIGYLRAYNSETGCWSSHLSINTYPNEIPDAPTLANVTITNNCGSTTLTKGSAPTNILFYWQDSEYGTSQLNYFVTSKTFTSGNVYYLRAINAANMNWSPALTINYTIDLGPQMPAQPSITYNVGSTTLSKNGVPPTGEQWYWQNSANGEDTSVSASANQIVLNSGNKYYLRSKNMSTGCWGDARVIDYVISNTVIEVPATPTITENCGSTKLEKNGTAPVGLTWYWQNNVTGTEMGANALGAEVNFTSSGTSYLRARENAAPNRWSDALPISYTVYSQPATPTLGDVAIVNNPGNTDISFVRSLPENVQWYWQNSANGTEESDMGNSKNFTEGTALYLRAKSTKVANCWSAALTINITVDPNPVPKPIIEAITITENCEQTILSYPTNQVPAGFEWYWQIQSVGQNMTYSDNSIALTQSGIYYLRAKDNGNIWSEALEIAYNVKQKPAVPTIQSIVNACSLTTITKNSNPVGATWYWQTSAENVDETDASLSREFNTGGTIYLRSKSDNGCWSEALPVTYTVNQTPVAPTLADISFEHNCNETKISKLAAPEGITWYWQTSAENVDESDNSSFKTYNANGIVYLRAKTNNIANCWSDALAINYTVNTQSTWYADTDGDGYGNVAVTLSNCSQPENYVSNSEDIDDSNPNITNIAPQYFYKDTDGDGFGDPNDSGYYSNQPEGYVANNTDNCPIEYGLTGGCDIYAVPTLSNENYIYTRAFQTETTTGTVSSNKDVIENITYFDGLGRPMQSIGIKQSGITGKDIITHIDYDAFGRQTKDYLPYVPSIIGNDGSYRTDALSVTKSFYDTEKYEYTLNPYSQKVLSGPAFNNPLEQAAPGDIWKTKYEQEVFFLPNAFKEITTFPILTSGTSVDFNAESSFVNYSINNGVLHIKGSIDFFAPHSLLPTIWFEIPELKEFSFSQIWGGDSLTFELKDANGNNTGHQLIIYEDVGYSFYHPEYSKWHRVNVKVNRNEPIQYNTNYVIDVEIPLNIPLESNYNSHQQNIVVDDVRPFFLKNDMMPAAEQITEFGQSITINNNVLHVDIRAVKSYYTDSFMAGNRIKINAPFNIPNLYLGKGYKYKLNGFKDSFDVYIVDNWLVVKNIESASNTYEVVEIDLEVNLPVINNEISHTIRFEERLNTLEDAICYYNVDLSLPEPELIKNGIYTEGDLVISIVKDENWSPNQLFDKDNIIEEYKDRNGMVILKRTYNKNITHDTYYVYDDFGNLTYVLPPKMDATTATITTINEQLSELGYQYKYDSRNRLAEKKIPGKEGWEYIVYNKRDQPILTQDGNLKAQSKWLFTKYDIFGRVAYTGLINSNSIRSVLQTAADAAISQYVAKSSSPVSIAGTIIYYNNDAYPNVLTTDEIQTINYYDNYTFDKDILTIPALAEKQAIINYNDLNQGSTKGLATGSKVRVLGTTSWITTITGYDAKARPIYTASRNNYLSTTDVVTSLLDFVGKVYKTTASHTIDGKITIKTVELFTYDHAGRLTKQTQVINDAVTPEVITENTYDELGQLASKGVGGKTSRLQTVNYAYNIRGWLKQINDPNILGTDLFGFKIGYNEGVKPLYNGNISSTEWGTASINDTGNLVSSKYNYTYDALNRITSGIDNTNNYSLSFVDYDKNGNIKHLNRNGQRDVNASSFGEMDKLTYFYQSASNKLVKTTDDATIDSFGFKDDALYTASDGDNDYTYDTNGNMKTDGNKGITSIIYNHLNLPIQIMFYENNENNPDAGSISYVYDATGIKIKKFVKYANLSNGKSTYYAGNYIYEQSNSMSPINLQFFNSAEGYVEPVNASNYSEGFNYVYQYKDHLGNIRLSYMDKNKDGDIDVTVGLDSEIIEENNYYPFGLKHKGYNTAINGTHQKYMFGGKEFDESFQTLNTYDFGARNYDPALGRWMNVDPLAEQMRKHSPYNYAFNNPIFFIDPDGMAPIPPDDYYYDKRGNQIDYVKNDQPDMFFVQDDKGGIEHNEQKYSQIDLNSEVGYLSRIIFAEAGGENKISKEAVGDVMKNRVESSKFPETYQKVAEQKFTTKKGFDVYQFSSVNPKDASNWRYSNPLSAKNQGEKTAFANSISAGIKVSNNGSGITNGALLYYSPKSMVPALSIPKWNFNLLKETTPAGISAESFKFYKYK